MWTVEADRQKTRNNLYKVRTDEYQRDEEKENHMDVNKDKEADRRSEGDIYSETDKGRK